jgi:oxygen-independent coproporphyrinogen-3 oxidase
LLPKPSFRIGQEIIAKEDLGFEFLMNVLRLNQGVEESLFLERTDLALTILEPQLSEFRNMGLIEEDRLCTTEKGHLFLNSILEKFADA